MTNHPTVPSPRGIEVLVNKASVDPEFKALLLEHRARAAGEIGLELSPTEAAMLTAISRDQLESIIAQTEVPAEGRRAFLGKAAAVMIAALGLGLNGCMTRRKCIGLRPRYVPGEEDSSCADQSTTASDANTDEQSKNLPTDGASLGLLPIYFDFDRAEVRPDQLDAMEGDLKRIQELAADGNKIIVVGHTDERGTSEYNFSLGERRGQAVFEYFVNGGARDTILGIISKGKEEPADLGHTPEAWARNRRVEFLVMKP